MLMPMTVTALWLCTAAEQPRLHVQLCASKLMRLLGHLLSEAIFHVNVVCVAVLSFGFCLHWPHQAKTR